MHKLVTLMAVCAIAFATLGPSAQRVSATGRAAAPAAPAAAGDGISFEVPLNVLRTVDHVQFGITQLTKGDFNGDGKLDLVGVGKKRVYTDLDAGFVYLSLGNGDGSFQGAMQLRPLSVLTRGYPSDPGTYCPIARDFNGDGKLDIATAAESLKAVAVMLGRGDGSFQPQVITTTFPFAVNCINTADLNGDGTLDIVARNAVSTKIMVAFGTGSGGFQTPVSYDTHSTIYSVSLGDVNNDGKVDIVYQGYNEAKFGLLLNNGSGGFPAAPQQISVGGSNILSLAVADYTGDGKLDVFAINSNCAQSGPTCHFGVLEQGNGNGTFQTPPPGNYFDSFTDGDRLDSSGDNAPPDLNGDGKPDLVILNAAVSQNAVTTMLNAGGTFGTRRRWIASVGSSRKTDFPDNTINYAFVAGDFSGDGNADIAIARSDGSGNGGINLVLGKGSGEFASPRMVEDSIAQGAATRNLALADFTGDGKLDLLSLGTNIPLLQVGLGNGTFITSGLTARPAGGNYPGITTGDINGDGKLDFVYRQGGLGAVPAVGINIGGAAFGMTSFRTAANGPSGSGCCHTQVLGDFNGDGKLDLALRDRNGIEIFLYPFPTNPAIDSTPFFTITSAQAGDGTAVEFFAGDLDGDGKIDLLNHSSNAPADNLEFRKGNGNGTFGSAVSVGSGYGPVVNMILRDLDADGKLDLLAAGNAMWFAKGLGDGSFLAPVKIIDNYNSTQTQLADFNSDGKLDIVTLHWSAGPDGIQVLEGKGNGTFGAPIQLPRGAAGITGVLAGDVNGDGKPDIIPSYYGYGSTRFANPVLLNTSGPHADLMMTMKASRQSVTTGTAVRFINVITNTGGSTAPAVTLRSLLPATAWTFESAEASQGSCSNASGAVSCVIGSMPFSTTQMITITARPLVDGQLAATASVTSTLADPDLGDNSASATVIVATAPPWVSRGANGGGGSVSAATGSVSTNANGKPVLRMARRNRSNISVNFSMNKLNLPGINAGNVRTTVIRVRIRYGSGYDMTETVTSDSTSDWSATIPSNDVVTGPLDVDVIICGTSCGDIDDVIVEWPWTEVELYDPSGIVSDRATGAPIVNATVTLYKVPGALPDEGGTTKQCRTVDTRPGGSGGNWDSLPAANPASGVLPDLLFVPGEISPVVNPQQTNSIGYYGWNVAKGCWFVKVEASGYKTVVSPLVGVPPAVLDLNIKMDRGGKTFLPLAKK
jgi:hypothetical protein